MSFRSHIQKRVMSLLGRPMTGAEYDVHEATLEALRDDAVYRAIKVLLLAMGPAARHDYQLDAGFHNAVDLVVKAVVSGVFDGFTGDTPDSLSPSLMDSLFGDINLKFAVHASSWSPVANPTILKSGSSGLPAAQTQQSAVTMKQIEETMATMKAQSISFVPPPQYITHPAHVDYGLEIGGPTKAKPKRRKAAVPQKKALAELAKVAEAQAKKLRVAKAPAKYQEMTGKELTPEEAELMIDELLEEGS